MNRTGKIVLAVIVVIAVVAIAAAASSGSDDGPEVRYNYSVQVTDSFGDGPFPETPSEGHEFAVVTFTFANDSYEDGFSTNPLMFVVDVVVDGLSYSTSYHMMSHPGYQLVDIMPGGTASCSYVFEIPSGTSAEDVEVQWEVQWTFDPPEMGSDGTLVVPEY